MIKQLTAT